MRNQGITDTDMGLAAIFQETEKLKSMCVKVGVTEASGSQTSDSGATIAEYAAYNEFGVPGPPVSQHGGGKWFIPPRPFLRGFIDGKRAQIAKMMEKLGGLVSGGNLKADEAIGQLGEFGQRGIRSYIRNGPFTPNADSTLARKKSSRPLIDTGAMRNAIRYEVIKKPINMVSEQ